uniref:Uncharacterized protein n=1 Tax=Strombidium rassoulzadegani TaxID=1082188 RepID=A0A7S3CMF1_9SPIT|mmetsp:Transcript_14021/g.23818  ORF Transcript_14021/g.23818 Transcript_14021/m.23818 type:complete len:157 (+) Transcript_14021:306-776(+)
MYKEWESSHEGRLALIILCDQLSRSFFRGKKEALMFDHIALSVTKRIISRSSEFNRYKLIERLFVILPLMHSENVDDCELSLRLLQSSIDYAELNHYDDVVTQLLQLKEAAMQFVLMQKAFGRFPHRNHYLGRQTTDEELVFIQTGQIPEISKSPS